jgi:A/G-specific adenine glycosylase
MSSRPAPEPRTDIDLDAFRRDLLAFYDDRRRDLPWRADSEPYRVWISEIMLQQTRVEAVIPYYERWLARFPDIAALAEADADSVLRTWEGLGYYSRARNLHAAARLVRERHHGRLPEEPDQLRALPGIGDYTAGAIASIAFGRAEPAVDGNVRRVFARLRDVARPAPALVRREVSRWIPRDRPGDFNQALMDLGATVCVPRSPRCGPCPVRSHCAAWHHGTQNERPAPRPVTAVPSFDIGTAAVTDEDGRLLLVRRPAGLLAGLWTLPGQPLLGRERAASAARRAAAVLIGGAQLGRARHRLDLPHTFSHRRENYRVYAFRLRCRGDAGRSHVWAAPDRLGDFALPTAQRRILAQLG